MDSGIMRKLLCILIGAIAFAFPATAPAQITNASIATDGLLYSAVEASNSFWNKRIYSDLADIFAQPITIYVYDELDRQVWARGEPGAIYFSRRLVHNVRKLLKTYGLRLHGLAYLWTVSVHERGHTLGFFHTEKGIMSKDCDGGNPPPDAYKWAKEIIRGTSK